MQSNISYWEHSSFFAEYDVVVIGSGIVGLSTAISFLEKHPNASVLIVEQGWSPAGASTKNAGFALHNRGALFTLAPGHPNTLMPRKRPLHTIIPGFMEKDGVRIGFGIMGGFNQPQAHAQFVANIADFDCTIQEALEAGRFTKGSFTG